MLATQLAAAAKRNGEWLGHSVAAAMTGMLSPGTGIEFGGAIVSGANLVGWKETNLSRPETTSSTPPRTGNRIATVATDGNR